MCKIWQCLWKRFNGASVKKSRISFILTVLAVSVMEIKLKEIQRTPTYSCIPCRQNSTKYKMLQLWKMPNLITYQTFKYPTIFRINLPLIKKVFPKILITRITKWENLNVPLIFINFNKGIFFFSYITVLKNNFLILL